MQIKLQLYLDHNAGLLEYDLFTRVTPGQNSKASALQNICLQKILFSNPEVSSLATGVMLH